MDARRCISYLTIEHRGAIAGELRTKVGGLVYGCDICQDVCPWNEKFSRTASEPAFAERPRFAGRDSRDVAMELLAMDADAYREAFRGSAMTRAKLPMLWRNAAIALGNVGTPDDAGILARARDRAEPLVREHAAWALQRLGVSAPADE
jgi:epoxyqueuosine reductase